MRPLLSLTALMLLLSGCAANINDNNYVEQSVGEVAETFEGIIVSARVVQVSDADEASKNGGGMLLGGATGGLAGNQFGKGSGNAAATIGGAVAGGLIGALAQSQLSKQPGMEYIVQVVDGENVLKVDTNKPAASTETTSFSRTNNRLLTVVQGVQPAYQVGQKVFVIISKAGRSRVVPNMAAQLAATPTPISTVPAVR